MDDPRRRPYFVFWEHRYEAGVVLALRMEAVEAGGAVRVTDPEGRSFILQTLRRALPRGGGSALLYRCPGCGLPRRYLYAYSVLGARLVSYLGWQCQACAGLRFASQGWHMGAIHRALRATMGPGGRVRAPLPRAPWDPRAVSNPLLLRDEFPEFFAVPMSRSSRTCGR